MDAETARHLGQLLGVEFRHDDRTFALDCQLSNLGGYDAARSTPRGPEVDQDGKRRLRDELPEVVLAGDRIRFGGRRKEGLAIPATSLLV